jgi:hypothetical protein
MRSGRSSRGRLPLDVRRARKKERRRIKRMLKLERRKEVRDKIERMQNEYEEMLKMRFDRF